MEFKNHKHRSEDITDINFIDDVNKRWNSLIGLYKELYANVKEKTKPMKNLLAFLNEISKEKEDLKPSKNIHYDYS